MCLSACVEVFHVNLLFYLCCDAGSLCVINLAAFVFICSKLFMFDCVYGSHAGAQYSSVGKTSELKA